MTSQTITHPMLEAVNEYSRARLAVIPLYRPNADGKCSCQRGAGCESPGKHPRVKWEQYQRRSPTTEELRGWRHLFETGNIGIICGASSGGLVGLDFDNRLALENLLDVDPDLRRSTVIVESGRGGHVWVRTPRPPTGFRIEELGLDLKGQGGLLVAPPSLHASGKLYGVVSESSNILEVEDFDAWLQERLERLGVDRTPSPHPDGNGIRPRLDICGALAELRQGNRNDTFARLVGKLHRGGLEPDAILDMLRPHAERVDFPLDELETEVQGICARYPTPAAEATRDTHTLAVPPSVVPDLAGQPWPRDAGEEAYHSLAGDIVRTLEPHTEADPHALLTNTLVAFGNTVGTGPHFMVGQDRHGMRLFAVLVGDTGHGRKGVSHAEIMALFKRASPDMSERVTTGLSSGEGLIWAVRDPIYRREPVKEGGRVVDYQEVETDAGVSDKRLLVVEPEFARTLKAMGREGNVLSAVARQAWDTGDLRVLTRTTPARATGAHVSIIGHITREELLRYLDSTEAANGFANRFLWVGVRRSKFLPDGGRVPESELGRLTKALHDALAFAASVGEMHRDAEARDIWHGVYEALSTGKPGLTGAVLGRAEAQVVRLSCIYALLDTSAVVRREHLLAAIAFWDRVDATVRYVFGDATGNPHADTILRALRSQGPLTQTAISSLFGRNMPAVRISQALASLSEAGLAENETEETTGRPVTVWRAK